MDIYTTLYKIEISNIGGTGTITECGIIYATDYTDAMRQLENYYGPTIVVVHHIEMFDMSQFTFKPELFDTIRSAAEDHFE